MAVMQTLGLLAALAGLLPLLCLAVAIACVRGRRGKLVHAMARRRVARRERELFEGLQRAVDQTLSADPGAVEALDQQGRLSIEEVAADLRRLGRLRHGVARTSSVWHDAILMAYDERLRLACRYLGVVEHLGGLGGVDLEIERVRVEGELLGMGLVLRGTTRWGQAA